MSSQPAGWRASLRTTWVDISTGARQLDLLEDERHFDPTERERKITAPDSNQTFTDEQRKWLDLIGQALRKNLSLEPDDFGILPILERAGGLGAARRTFGKDFDKLLRDMNGAVAALTLTGTAIGSRLALPQACAAHSERP